MPLSYVFLRQLCAIWTARHNPQGEAGGRSGKHGSTCWHIPERTMAHRKTPRYGRTSKKPLDNGNQRRHRGLPCSRGHQNDHDGPETQASRGHFFHSTAVVGVLKLAGKVGLATVQDILQPDAGSAAEIYLQIQSELHLPTCLHAESSVR